MLHCQFIYDTTLFLTDYDLNLAKASYHLSLIVLFVMSATSLLSHNCKPTIISSNNLPIKA